MRYFYFTILLLICSSCALKTDIEIFNNTNDELTVNIGESMVIGPQKKVVFKMPYSDAVYIKINWGQNQYTYLLPIIPDNYRAKGILSDKVILQFNYDKKIVIAKRNEKVPISSIINQPDSFPLKAIEILHYKTIK